MRHALSAILLALVAGSCSPTMRGPVLVYRLETLDGGVAPDDRIARAVAVIAERLNRAGYHAQVEASSDAGKLTIALRAIAEPEAIEAMRKLVERSGMLEFRIRAEPSEERQWMEMDEKNGGVQRLSDYYAWVPLSDEERPIMQRVAGLIDKHSEDSIAFSSAKTCLEETLRYDVFTGDQLVRAEVVRQTRQFAVAFEFKAERMASFEAFTGKHVGESLAIIIDGKVISSPKINSKLPGMGVISGGGAAGFTEAEAKDLAAILGAGTIPGRLVYVSTQEPK
jgi:preprotein translocase subunit SecD